MEDLRVYVRRDDIVSKGLWRLFPAINCDRSKDIPTDYPGPIGVPITWMDYYDPEKFELLDKLDVPKIDGKRIFKRLIIRLRHPDLPDVVDLNELLARCGSEYRVAPECMYSNPEK